MTTTAPSLYVYGRQAPILDESLLQKGWRNNRSGLLGFVRTWHQAPVLLLMVGVVVVGVTAAWGYTHMQVGRCTYKVLE